MNPQGNRNDGQGPPEALWWVIQGLAHDFNNLLAGILMSGELLLTSHPEPDPHRREVEIILRSSRQLAELSQQLLELAQRKGQPAQMAPVVLNQLIQDIVPLSSSHAVSIVLNLAAELPPVWGDKTQLRQMLLNLCVNALEAMPQGGKLTITTTPLRLDQERRWNESRLDPGPYILLQVRDTGIGIDPAEQERIFEPFFSTKARGRGLGLAIVSGVVQSHGGGMEIASERGKGTSFRIYLPACTPGDSHLR